MNRFPEHLPPDLDVSEVDLDNEDVRFRGERLTEARAEAVAAEVDERAHRVAPIRSREWTDEDGTRWRLRGAGPGVQPKRLERLLHDHEVRVLLVDCPGPPADVPVADRGALWTRMLPYLRGKVEREPNDQTEFAVGEFKDPSGRSLLIIDEYC